MGNPDIIISMTSYPGRIKYVSQVLGTIFAQTKAPDKIILWLAEEEFPGREESLPAELISFSSQGRITIRWCDNLKAHKKYYYAFHEYHDALIITVDDDILYAEDMVAY